MNKKILVLVCIMILSITIGVAGQVTEDSGSSRGSTIAQTGHIEWTIIKTGLEEDLEIEYEDIDDTSTEFCIEVPEKYKDAIGVIGKQVPITKTKGDFIIETNTIDLTRDTVCFNVIYLELVLGMEFKIGFGTVTIATSTDEGAGNNRESWQHRVFYDPNNDRWHVIYIASDADIHSASSADGITWTDGIDIDAATYDYDDFSCALDLDGATTYLHCVYAPVHLDYMNYRRCELTGTTPFISCGAEQIPYDASDLGESSLDHVEYPKIVLDSNDCALIAFVSEDDSQAASEEWGVNMIKEKATCGDGTFAIADLEDGFPIYKIQNGTGYDTTLPIGLESFGDLDAQLFWLNTTQTGLFELYTAYFNGTSNGITNQSDSSEILLEHDVEWNNAHFYSVIVGERVITFAMDDGTQDLDAYITTVKNGTLSSQVDTGIDMDDQGGTAGYVTAVVDTRSTGENDIWVFAVDDNDDEDIYYAVSTDGGDTWTDQTLWQDEAGINEVKYLSAFFDNETCNIGVSWLNGSVTPWEVEFDNITTSSCVAVDTTPPTYSNQAQNISTFYTDSAIQFNATITDADNNVLYWNFSWNCTGDDNWVNITNSTDLTDPSQANHSIESIAVGEVCGYMFCSADDQGNVGCDTLSTLTISSAVDSTPPTFTTSPYNKTTTNESAEISWTTNETANYTLTIGLCPSFTGINSFSNATPALTHDKWIDNLQNSTNYCVNVTATDASDNSASENVSFTTASNLDQTAPVISNLRNTSTTNESSFVEWDCNENCNYTISWYNNSARTSQYLIGTINNNTFGLSHNPHLSNLLNSTTYYISLEVSDSVGNAASDDTFSFTTAANIEEEYANEEEGDTAIQLGIESSEIWTASVYDSYQVSGANLTNQFSGRFDKFAKKDNKRWAINYVSAGESSITGIFSITPSLYVLQLEDLSSEAITDQVGDLINSTYP